MLGVVYERLLDLSKQVDQNNQVLLAFAETMQNMVDLSDIQDAKLNMLRKAVTGEEAGVSLSSVPLTNDD
jgi:hypothetical protein